MVKRVQKKLVIWKKSYILLGGRITLIKATISNVPVYYMSLFHMLRKVSLIMKKYQWDFFWDRGRNIKDHLVKYENVCRRKEYRWLGMGHLRKGIWRCLGTGYDIFLMRTIVFGNPLFTKNMG